VRKESYNIWHLIVRPVYDRVLFELKVVVNTVTVFEATTTIQNAMVLRTHVDAVYTSVRITTFPLYSFCRVHSSFSITENPRRRSLANTRIKFSTWNSKTEVT
jgi:hypothetical protein